MRKLLCTSALCACVAAGAGAALAQPAAQMAQGATGTVQPRGDVIADIIVRGNQRIEPATILSYMTLSPGDPFAPARINRSLKNLFDTGLFADVVIRREGDRLIVEVVENPIINRIAFEGNLRIEDEVLAAETELRPRVVFTRGKVQADVERILEVYRRSGRFAAVVEPKVIQLEQNRVDLVFEIDEGPATTVSGINFVGNRRFDDSRLRGEILTKESRWYRFLTASDTYDPDRLEVDQDLLRRFYLQHGYIDFAVTSVAAELSPDRTDFLITFTVSEGERYRVGEVNVDVALPELQAEDLRSAVQVQEGEWYNAEQVETTIQDMVDLLGRQGYAFVDIRPRLNRRADENIVDVTFEVEEGPRVFVDRIEISGNVRTMDEVIRREMQLVEGDAFNAAKLRRSRQRIYDLGFFNRVDVETREAPDAPDQTVVEIEVEERSTGELMLGFGWSSAAGALGQISLRERNLLGRGQDLRLSATLAQERSQYDISFTEPYFLDRPLRAGFDLYRITEELQDESSYDTEALGGALRVGYYLADNLRQDVAYTLRRTTVDNIDDSASFYIQQQEGSTTLSSIQQTLTYDLRDSRLEPTEGYFLRLNNEIAGLGGDQYFLRNNLSGGYYIPVADQVVLSLSGTAGVITGIGDDVFITERYYLGGETLRGFEGAGVSPRTVDGNDAVGGLWMAAGSVEATFPLGLPEELGIKGSLFTDFGTIGDTEDDVSVAVDQESSLRLSVGFGFNWRSPMGPLSIDFGFPILKEDFDETQTLRVNFGTRF